MDDNKVFRRNSMGITMEHLSEMIRLVVSEKLELGPFIIYIARPVFFFSCSVFWNFFFSFGQLIFLLKCSF